MSYFLIAISNRRNLELCVSHSIAGFTSSANGLWTWLDVQDGDFVSFLYGARVFNLYQVSGKVAYKEAERLPPWPPVTFRAGRTYYFPFRLNLRKVRKLQEPLVRAEFAYVAENLLLRGGYRKTHFQADQTTLQAVSEMGELSNESVEELSLGAAVPFVPRVTRDKASVDPPEVFLFREIFLQALTRHHLSQPEPMSEFLNMLGLSGILPTELEVLSEKAFPEGHVDLLVKEAVPRGISRKIILEVKSGAATERDLQQLRSYKDTLGDECLRSVLISRARSRKIDVLAQQLGIVCLNYSMPFTQPVATFGELLSAYSVVS